MLSFIDRISVHRSVLIATVPYFKQFFSTETTENNKNRITLRGVTSEAIKEIINFCYTGKLEINMKNVGKLLEAADVLDCELVEDHCVNYLQKSLKTNPEICFSVQSIADFYDYEDLSMDARQCALENFSKIKNGAAFLNLRAYQIKYLFSDDHLKVAKEEEVFEALLTWINHDRVNRENDFLDLLKCVRYAEFSDEVNILVL